ncbi:MAG: hypothetical protein GY825_14810, partial [Phycisphaeraceae bacterium]|nr:hypothetical protein [Phycisphaeraceae bacterium]
MPTSDLPIQGRLDPRTCVGCGAGGDGSDERCMACGMRRPVEGWAELPSAIPDMGGWGDDSPTGIHVMPDAIGGGASDESVSDPLSADEYIEDDDTAETPAPVRVRISA